ncbi:MAG: type I secretion C-terminal target domain-containing protein [Rhizobiales bacterium]|nr:type I secretion C-terminal target domain-containing protein [Hyphomicrobiales bacterium]MBN9489975.1 type I secretion C-terminal target domain-containing protein [Alphaproteobacteria bacterium]
MTTNLFALGNIVTQEQLENSFSILWRSSAAFRGMIEDIQLAGDTVSIDVIDATEYPAPTVPGMDPVSYSLTNVDAVGISTVVITEQYLQNIQYKTDYANGTTADVSLERVIAHEMAHAWQHATGVAQDEEQAAELENTIMKTLGEPPREGDPNSTQPTYDDSATFAPAPHPIRLYDPAHPLPPEILSDIQPGAGNAASVSSPLVIDLSATHSGVTLTEWNAATTGTFFDLNENGFAVQTAWVTGDTGLLARDLNANGRIDSTAELFGSPTVDGFAKLAVLDSNHDMRIDANDEAWSTLVVWTDTNGDAVTQEGELHSLASLGIANIDLAGVAASTSTISGNPISHTSTVTFTDGATATVADAWFVHDNTNSYYAEDYTLDAEVLFLPTLRGYGTLPDLSIAMSQDSDLKDMVADFVGSFTLADIGTADAAITEILFKWAGIEGVSSSGRGAYIDGQHLAFLEHFLGSTFIQEITQSPNPTPAAGRILEQTYHEAYDLLSADILVQVGAETLFANAVNYNAYTGSFDGDLSLSQSAIADLVSIAPSAGPDNEAFWVAIGRFLEATKGLENLTVSEVSWLEAAVNETDETLHWTNAANIVAEEIQGSGTDDTIYGEDTPDIIHGNEGNDRIYGEAGNDTLYGDAGNDLIYGGAGDDVIYGGDGDDTLYGSGGDDTYYAGTGGNTITGGSDNDTYVYGGGDDVILEYGGSDQIVLPTGVSLSDLTITRVSTSNSHNYFDDLLIQIDGSGSIQIHGQFSNAASKVETLVFSDSSTLDLTALSPDVYLTSGNDNFSGSGSMNYTIYGFDGNDSIFANGSGDHIIDGGNGNDTLRGGSASNDTYVASAGFDTIFENSGTDTIVIPAEFTLDDVSFYRILGTSGPTNDLGITIQGLGEITIQQQLGNVARQVEYLAFLHDNTTLTLTDISVATIGTAADDRLYAPTSGASPNDVIDGREGDDYLAAGNGNDIYVFSQGHDIIYDTGGDDTIRVRESYTPEDITILWNYNTINSHYASGILLTDSDGNSVLVEDQSTRADNMIEHIVFSDGTIWNLDEIELSYYGTEGNDNLSGRNIGDASSDDTIYGLGGNDTINGDDGDDLIYGGDGDDYLLGKHGNDTVYGDDGDDILYAASSDGDDLLYGGAGNDTLKGANHSVLHGGDGDDQLYNIATSPYATNTSVTMYGGLGDDSMFGGYGHTTMNGEAGADTLTGSNSGVDTFTFDAATAFDAVDTVKSFMKSGTNHDAIDISDILDGHFDPVNDAITDFVQFSTNGSNTEVYVDPTGARDFSAAAHIATIQSVTGLEDEAALVSSGLLLAA